MKIVTFLKTLFLKSIKLDRDFIELLVVQAKEQTLKSKTSGIAFFNQILDEISWFDIQTRKLVKKAKKEVLQNV